jgi:hypothetical protein
MNGAMKSRRTAIARVWAATTSHLVESLAVSSVLIVLDGGGAMSVRSAEECRR